MNKAEQVEKLKRYNELRDKYPWMLKKDILERIGYYQSGIKKIEELCKQEKFSL